MTGENDMTGRIGDEEKMERVWGGERVYTVKQKVLFLTAFEDISADCALETNFLHVYPLLSISEFHPQKELPSSHYLLAAHSISPLPFGLFPHPGLQRLPRQRHTGFNTPVSPQSAALFVRCVDAFIGLKWLLCSLPAVYSQAVIPLLTTVCGLVMQFV